MKKISLTLTQKDLADRFGSTRESVNKEFRGCIHCKPVCNMTTC